MLLKAIKNMYHKELDPLYPKEEVDSFFYLVIEHYLHLERFVLAIQPNLIIDKEKEQPLFEALAQLKQERPIQYILGETEFMDITLKVDSNVLIPRPETEELVRWILSELENNAEEVSILDVGTGSGCIAIALATQLPHAKIYALDVSEKALKIAGENAEKHKVAITLIHADILKLNTLDTPFDIIVSNPPYVRVQEKEQMHSNVLKNEPRQALFVEDEDPLIFYRHIIDFANIHLKKEGLLYFEINQYLGKETSALLTQGYTELELRKDLFGNDRMLKGRKK